jgi:Fe-S oxidoreductase
VNLVTQTPGLSHLAKVAAGMPLRRTIPEFAPQTFRKWFSGREAQSNGARGKVILWPDTFNNYFFPETAQAATEVIERAGFQVEVPSGHLCCGRPLYDYGMLNMAKHYLQRIMDTLRPQIEAGTPFIVLEPSCASVFRDELINLFPNDILAHKLKAQTLLLSEFLEKKAKDHPLPQIHRKALVQGHCHHKSVLKFDDENSVLKKLGLEANTLHSGCCGMAGSFGFESDKYDGFSCREQIAQETDRHGLHLAEVIHLAEQNPDSSEDQFEAKFIAKRKAARRNARLKALGAVLAIAGGTLLLAKRLGR